MDRQSKVECTKQFHKDYPYSCDYANLFIKYWIHPFLKKVYPSRKEAYDAIDNFIKCVKTSFKQDYGNHIIPNICRDWFDIVDYK